jgi:DNA-binding transcriptional MerR regulator
MLIGELSARTGLSRDTIRFYEKQGLIKLHKKERRDNNYKEYSEATLNRLETIVLIKNLGFTLNETADLLDKIAFKEATCNNMQALLEKKMALLDAKIMDLMLLREQLANGVRKCRQECVPINPAENCPRLELSPVF